MIMALQQILKKMKGICPVCGNRLFRGKTIVSERIMKFLELKPHDIPLIFLFLFIKWGYGCMLESVLILKKFIHQKSLSYAPPAINRNELCPWFPGSLSE